jgi:hypothetical protein
MSGKLTLTGAPRMSRALLQVLEATRAVVAPVAAPTPAPAPKAAPRAVAPAQRAVVAAAPEAVAVPKAPKPPKPERPPVFEHLPADEETAKWNRLREDEWIAAHPPPPPLHQPADAETIAWNARRELEWLAAPGEIEATLRDLCPLAFRDPPVPLAIGIHQPLVDLLSGEHEQIHIKRFLQSWTRQEAYRSVLIEGAARVDLDGQQIGVVTPEEAVHAGRSQNELHNNDGITEEVPDLK